MNQSAIRVLIVDDEPAIRRAIRPPLVELGFQIFEASRGEEALQMLHAAPVDVVLLDINMPGLGGIETLRRIRTFAPRLPVLMLTVRDGEEDKVEALELGADDYVTKPFYPRELLARVRNVLARSPASHDYRGEPDLRLRGWLVYRDNRKVVEDATGRDAKLTAAEFDLLMILAAAPGRLFEREDLAAAVGDKRPGHGVRSVDVLVSRLRSKLADEGEDRLIETVRGFGYRLVPGV